MNRLIKKSNFYARLSPREHIILPRRTLATFRSYHGNPKMLQHTTKVWYESEKFDFARCSCLSKRQPFSMHERQSEKISNYGDYSMVILYFDEDIMFEMLVNANSFRFLKYDSAGPP